MILPSANIVLAWGLFLAAILTLLSLDLFILHRKPHAIRFREALLGAIAPIVAASAFLLFLWFAYNTHFLDLGQPPAHLPIHHSELRYYPANGEAAVLQFLTGYLVELSLSADNVFLFLLFMRFFKVPPALQHRVLFWGVLGALAMRASLIILGSALLTEFQWVIYLLGAFILFAGIRMFLAGNTPKDPSSSFSVRLAHKLLPIHPEFVGKKFFVKMPTPSGRTKRFATTLFVVLLCIEVTDLVFALDSIPAIFGITKDTFLVFSSNVFAILGLRSMYFLLAGVMDRFHYLRHALAFILAFVGIKMLLPLAADAYAHFAHVPDPDWHVSEFASLALIIAALTTAITLSLLFPQKPAMPPPPRAVPLPADH